MKSKNEIQNFEKNIHQLMCLDILETLRTFAHFYIRGGLHDEGDSFIFQNAQKLGKN